MKLKLMKNKHRNFILFASIFAVSCSFAVLANTLESEGSNESSVVKLERHFVFDTIPQTLDDITKSAGKIFAGKCTNVEYIENDSESKLPVIKYTFEVAEGIRGVGDEEEITFKQWQPTARSSGYEEGKKYFLFLYPESERGLTTPVALEQGRFKVSKKGLIQRKEVVINGFSNKGLTRNLKTRKRILIKKDRFINDYLDQCSENGAPIRYKEFVQAVKYLAEE